MLQRPTTQRAEAAIQRLQEADKLTTRRPLDPLDCLWNQREAERLRAKGQALLTAPAVLDATPKQPVALHQVAGVFRGTFRRTTSDPVGGTAHDRYPQEPTDTRNEEADGQEWSWREAGGGA